MNYPTLSVADYVAIVGLVGAALGFVVKMLHRMRTNDLHHLDEKIDGVVQTVDRIEGKIDDHVRDHATGVFQ